MFKLQVSSVKSADLESALLMLPFSDALRLLSYLPDWLLVQASHNVFAGCRSCKPPLYYINRCMGKCQIMDTIYRCYLVYFL